MSKNVVEFELRMRGGENYHSLALRLVCFFLRFYFFTKKVNMFTVKRMKLAMKRNLPLYLLFIILKEAFKTVRREFARSNYERFLHSGSK